MSGQAQPFNSRALPQQAMMPQQTMNMLGNRFSNFMPNIMTPQVMPQATMGQTIMPNDAAIQNAAAAANLIGRFPIAAMPGQIPSAMGGIPNQMAFQNANPMAGLESRFQQMTAQPVAQTANIPNQMAFQNANLSANLASRFPGSR